MSELNDLLSEGPKALSEEGRVAEEALEMLMKLPVSGRGRVLGYLNHRVHGPDSRGRTRPKMSETVDGSKIARAITQVMNVMEPLSTVERDRLTAVIATHYLGKEPTLQLREAAIRVRMDQMREAAGYSVMIPLIGTTRDEQPARAPWAREDLTMSKSDSTGPGRDDRSSGGSSGGSNGGAGTGPGRTEGTGRDGNQGGRGTGSGTSR